jgi:alkanesulfonate monooxygenase SsuD/methylene tetrahydromethanopterin reductase-like flavin-dependent oxidoreductase (luciferase family)
VSSQELSAAENLLANPGFDVPVPPGEDGLPGWAVNASGEQDRWALDPDVTSGTGRSLRFEIGQSCSANQQLAPPSGATGKRFLLQLDVRREGPVTAVAQLLALNPELPPHPVLQTGAAGMAQVVVSAGATSAFRTYRSSFVASGEPATLQLSLAASGTGKVWFDNLSVTLADDEPPLASVAGPARTTPRPTGVTAPLAGDVSRDSIKFGILPSPNYTTWPDLRDIGRRVDELGYTSLWCSDHLYAPDPTKLGPVFEGYTVLGAWAAVTTSVTLGLMVGCNNFRNPALTVKMATTLDHISNGRAVLAVGAGWFEGEHAAFGMPFGPPKQRLDRLEEALGIMRTMLDGEAASGRGSYTHDSVRNLPRPVQARLPILIGGGGEKRMLRIIAEYADIWNIAGTYEDVARKDRILREHCETIGRDPDTIERQFHGGPMFIRDDEDEVIALTERTFAHHGLSGIYPPLMGNPDELVARLQPFAELGFRNMYFDSITPYDDESLERMIKEVKPRLEAALLSAPCQG